MLLSFINLKELRKKIYRKSFSCPLTRNLHTIITVRSHNNFIIKAVKYSKNFNFNGSVHIRLDNPFPSKFKVSDDYNTWLQTSQICKNYKLANRIICAGYNCLPSSLPYLMPNPNDMKYGFRLHLQGADQGTKNNRSPRALIFSIIKAFEIEVAISGQLYRYFNKKPFITRDIMMKYYKLVDDYSKQKSTKHVRARHLA